jgi:thermostable 8-oxoguanine DNA glycosylase
MTDKLTDSNSESDTRSGHGSRDRKPSLKWWARYHEEDYDAVERRLSACRNVMLYGRMDSATRMLKLASVNAVMSIQTSVDRHERAFTMWQAGDRSLKTCLQETTYGNQKYGWVSESLATFDFQACVEILRHGTGPQASNIEQTVEYLVDNFKGLSYTKASFTLAMIGVWECACLDSHMRRLLGIDTDKSWSSVGAYQSDVERMVEHFDTPFNKPFLIQWSSWDRERGEHTRHMSFYREALPALVN